MEEFYKIIQESIYFSEKYIAIANPHNKNMIDWIESQKKSIERLQALLPN